MDVLKWNGSNKKSHSNQVPGGLHSVATWDACVNLIGDRRSPLKLDMLRNPKSQWLRVLRSFHPHMLSARAYT